MRRGCAAPLTRLDPDTPVGANEPRLRLATLLKVGDNGCNASILFFRTPCMLSRIILNANNYLREYPQLVWNTLEFEGRSSWRRKEKYMSLMVLSVTSMLQNMWTSKLFWAAILSYHIVEEILQKNGAQSTSPSCIFSHFLKHLRRKYLGVRVYDVVSCALTHGLTEIIIDWFSVRKNKS